MAAPSRQSRRLASTRSQQRLSGAAVASSKLAAQMGGAVALGTLLTPVAALLAFVDGGLAKDANCVALIGQAEQTKNLPKE